MDRPASGVQFDAGGARCEAQSRRLPWVAGGLALLLAIDALTLLFLTDGETPWSLARTVALTAVVFVILAEAWRRWPARSAVSGAVAYLLLLIVLLLAGWHALQFDLQWSPAAIGLALAACGLIFLEPFWFTLGAATVLSAGLFSMGGVPPAVAAIGGGGILTVALILALALRHGQALAAVRREELRWQEQEFAERLAQAEEATRVEGRRRHAADIARFAALSYQDWLGEHAQEVLLRVDAEGQILAVTRAAAWVLGRPDQDLLGTNFLEGIHPEDRPNVDEQRRTCQKGEPASMLCRWMRPFTEDAWITVTWRAMSSDRAEPVEWTATVRDGTIDRQLKLAQTELERCRHELNEARHDAQVEQRRRMETEDALEEAAETVHHLRQQWRGLAESREQAAAEVEQERVQWLAEAARLRDQRDASEAKGRSLGQELDLARKQLVQHQARIRELGEQLALLQDQVAQNRERENRSREHEQELAQRLAALKEQEPRWQQEVARLNGEIDRLRRVEKDLSESARAARDELAAAKAELRAWQTRPTAPEPATWQPILDELNQLRVIEAELRRQHDQLLVELRRMGERTTSAPGDLAATWEWEWTTDTVTASPECKALLGFSPHESLPALSNLCHTEDLPALRESLRLHREHRLPLAVEVRLRRHSGEFMWVMLRGQLVDRTKGGLEKLAGTLADVSQVKRLDDELRAARQTLERVEHQREAFMAHLNHEVRTPLAALAGYAEMLLDPQLAPSDRPAILRGLRRNVRQVLGIVQDVLDLAQVETGKARVTLREVKPWAMIRGVFDELARIADERRLVLRVVPLGSMPRDMHTDPERFRQILWHLGMHALHATAKGEVVVRAAVEAGVEGATSWWRLEVVDQSGGLSTDAVRTLLQIGPGVPSLVAAGSGESLLGLTLSHRLAQLLGGELRVQNQPGQGTCFTLRLPLARSEAENLVQVGVLDSTIDRAPAKATRRPQLAGRVLLAMPNKDIQRVVHYVLERAGLRVDVVDHGRDALEQAQGGQHAALLLDTRLQEINGYTLARQLRLHQDRRPLLALYTPAAGETESACREAGFDVAIPQPIDPDQVLLVLQNLLPPPGLSDSAPPLPMAQNPAPEPAVEDAILSLHHADPAMMHMVREYVAGLPARVAEFRAALRAADLARMIKLAHQTKNAASQYGYSALSEAAGLLQAAVAEGQESSLLSELLDEIANLVRRIQSAFA